MNNPYPINIKTGWRRTASVLMLASALFAMPALYAGQRGASYFGNAPLTNQDGKILHFYDDVLKGKVVSINFMFTNCGYSCPLETAKLRHLQKMLGDHVGKDVFMYSITVDPDRDTPEVLKEYMEKYRVGPGWQFLTGKESDIKMIRKRLDMYRESESDITEHNVNYIIGNEKTGQWLKRTPFDAPETLVTALVDRLQTVSGRAQRGGNYAAVRAKPNITKGEDLFRSRCSACHTVGAGDEIGPDLLGVADRRDRLWLIRWLKEPDVMLREKDPVAMALFNRYKQVAMPNVKLIDSDIQHLITYLQNETRRVHARSLGRQTHLETLSGQVLR